MVLGSAQALEAASAQLTESDRLSESHARAVKDLGESVTDRFFFLVNKACPDRPRGQSASRALLSGLSSCTAQSQLLEGLPGCRAEHQDPASARPVHLSTLCPFERMGAGADLDRPRAGPSGQGSGGGDA